MRVDPTLLNKYPHPSIYLLKYVVDISLPSSIYVCTWKQVSMTDGGSWFSSAVVKGQKISKGHRGVLSSSKKKINKFFCLISVLASKKWLNQKIKGL